MQNVYRRAVRANAVALYALALAAAVAFPAHSAFAASGKTSHARNVAARAHAEVPTTVACTVAGCKPVPVSCHAAPQAGTEPGYAIISCP
ncbi:MAG: hypothetical protein JSR72_08865 [Proteobacteria bacterium]|nr:hypothetical protein [Pseudomonadota bacterium]